VYCNTQTGPDYGAAPPGRGQRSPPGGAWRAGAERPAGPPARAAGAVTRGRQAPDAVGQGDPPGKDRVIAPLVTKFTLHSLFFVAVRFGQEGRSELACRTAERFRGRRSPRDGGRVRPLAPRPAAG
jgi:hypothetical protein